MFKTKREAHLNLNVNYLCYALRALFWTLIIINWTLIIPLIFSLIFLLMFYSTNSSLPTLFITNPSPINVAYFV